jgi:hypothetical protein
MRRLIATALLALVARPAMAQVTVDFTPKLGAYVPLENFTDKGVVTKRQTQFAIGARLGLWFSPSVGLEGTVDYSKPDLDTRFNGVSVSSVSGTIFAASLRPAVKLSSPSGATALLLSAGGGIVSEGGDVTAGLAGKTDIAPAAGVGLLVRLTRVVDARFDVDGYSYKPTLTDANGNTLAARRQYDLFVSFGLRGVFGRF